MAFPPHCHDHKWAKIMVRKSRETLHNHSLMHSALFHRSLVRNLQWIRLKTTPSYWGEYRFTCSSKTDQTFSNATNDIVESEQDMRSEIVLGGQDGIGLENSSIERWADFNNIQLWWKGKTSALDRCVSRHSSMTDRRFDLKQDWNSNVTILPSLVSSYWGPLWEHRCSADRDNHKYPWVEQSMCPRKYPSNKHVW